MADAMERDHYDELLAGYVLYDLSAEEYDALMQFVADNPAAAAEFDPLQQTLDAAYVSGTLAPPPAALRDRIMTAQAQRLASSQPVPVPEPVHRPSQRRLSLLPTAQDWKNSLGAIAALLIVGLSISNYALWRSLQTLHTEMAQEPSITFVLQAVETDIEATSVQINANPAALKATLVIENLPPPPPGKVYVLWTVLAEDAPFTTDSKNAILTQTFTVDGDGTLTQQIDLTTAIRQMSVVEAVAVTLEDAAAPQNHEASPILIQKF